MANLEYNKNFGYVPKLRDERLGEMFTNNRIYTGSQTDFKASNWAIGDEHALLKLEQIDEQVVKLTSEFQKELLDSTTNTQGTSNFGWKTQFIDTGLARGLIFERTNDGTYAYFDMLDTSTPEKIAEIQERLKFVLSANFRSLQAVGFTLIQVAYDNSPTQDFWFFNLQQENYTKLELQLTVYYIEGGEQYDTTYLKNLYTENFNSKNFIGQNFYPNNHLDLNELKSIFKLSWQFRVEGDTTWITDEVLLCENNQKYVLSQEAFTIGSGVIAMGIGEQGASKNASKQSSKGVSCKEN